jgi:hypothetical protein
LLYKSSIEDIRIEFGTKLGLILEPPIFPIGFQPISIPILVRIWKSVLLKEFVKDGQVQVLGIQGYLRFFQGPTRTARPLFGIVLCQGSITGFQRRFLGNHLREPRILTIRCTFGNQLIQDLLKIQKSPCNVIECLRRTSAIRMRPRSRLFISESQDIAIEWFTVINAQNTIGLM